MWPMKTDILITVGTFFAARYGFAAIGAPFPGQWALACALCATGWRLHRGGLGLAGLGLRRPAHWPRALGWALVAYLGAMLLNALVVAPLSHALGLAVLDTTALGDLRGNLPRLAGMLLLTWTLVAFGEELLFRGFLLTRLESTLGSGAAAVLVQALLFGAGHAYLGARGALAAGAVGLAFGTVYLLAGRNLWPVILAHGLIDTMSLVALFSGAAIGN